MGEIHLNEVHYNIFFENITQYYSKLLYYLDLSHRISIECVERRSNS
jgi:hypothetical protein